MSLLNTDPCLLQEYNASAFVGAGAFVNARAFVGAGVVILKFFDSFVYRRCLRSLPYTTQKINENITAKETNINPT